MRTSGILFLGGLLGIAVHLGAAPQDRVYGSIDGDHRRVDLQNNVRPEVLTWTDAGVIEPWRNVDYMRLVLRPSEQQTAELRELLERQRDPSSPDYQRWLTPEEYGDRFGFTDNDLGRLTSWLQAEGFKIEKVARAKNWIAFSGTAETVSTAFATELHRYSLHGETHFANTVEPSIPASLADVVEGIRGLNDFHPKPPKLKQMLKSLRPDYTTSSGVHYLAPGDLAVIYDFAPLYQAGFDGSGQKVIIPGQTDIELSDIQAFRSEFGLPAKVPQMVLYGKDPGTSSGDQMEADLDVEWSGAVARNATIIYVYSQDVFESLQYAIDQNLGAVISLSYGGCETGNPASFQSVAQQANAQGMTWMNAAGDSGAAGCDPQGANSATQGPAVTFPANIPEVTAVGGTEFVESGSAGWGSNGTNLVSATSYIPEKAWNATPLGQGIEAGGGGASAMFSKPWWQAGQGVPNDNARDVPDVAMAAAADHDGYLMYAQGTFCVVGGTSASSPSFAGIIALLNQYLVAKGVQAKPGLGNINPKLYVLAETAGVFHDITAGNNIVPCKTGSTGCTSGSFGYSAGPGYDLATGLGSVDAYNLVTKWSSAPAGVGTTLTLAASSTSMAPSGTSTLTAKVMAVSGSSAPTGTVAFTLEGQLLGTATLTASTGSTAAATLMLKGNGLSSGNNTIGATYSPSGNFVSSSGTTAVTVTAPVISTSMAVTASPASLLSTSTTQLVATVKPSSGSTPPTGTVTFSLGATTLGKATLAASGTTSSATLVVKGSSLVIGSNSISVNYVATGNFGNSAASISVIDAAPPVATTTSIVASPQTIASGASTQLTATVKATSNTTAPTGNVTFALGSVPLGTASLSTSGTASIATLTLKSSSLAIGTNKISVNYVASGNFTSSSTSATVTVTAPPVATTTSLVASPAAIVSTASTQLSATVKPASGTSQPTGNITFSSGSKTLGSVLLTASGANLTVKGSSLAIGTNSITVSYTATGNFSSSGSSTTVTVSAPSVTTTTSVAANPPSIASTGTTQLIATVKAASGIVLSSGTVSFSAGSVILGSVPLSASGAVLTVKGSTLAIGNYMITATYNAPSGIVGSTGSTPVAVVLLAKTSAAPR